MKNVSRHAEVLKRSCRGRFCLPWSAALLVLCLGICSSSAWATQQSWSSTAATTAWATGTNWVSTTAPGATDTALFDQTSYTSQPNAGTTSIAGITVGDGATVTAPLTITTTALTIGTSGITINANSGTVALNTSVVLNGVQTWTNNSASPFTVTATINNGTNTLTIAGSGSTLLNGAFTAGGGGITTTGTGTLTLGATNLYTGPTSVGAGTTVNVTNLAGLGAAASTATVASGGQINFNITGTITEGFNLTGAGGTGSPGALVFNQTGNAIGSGKLTIASGGATVGVTTAGQTTTAVAPVITGTLTKAGAGTLSFITTAATGTGALTVNAGILTTSVNVASTSINANNGGTFRLTGPGTNSIPDAAVLSVASGGVLDWEQTGAETVGSIGINGTGIGGTGAIVNNAATAGGTISGAVTLNGASTIGAITGGSLKFGTTMAVGTNTLTFAGAGSFTMTTGAANNFSFSGAGNLVMNGTGTLTLTTSSANAIAGAVPITINSGTLVSNVATSTVSTGPLGTGTITLTPLGNPVLSYSEAGQTGDSSSTPFTIANSASGTATIQITSGGVAHSGAITLASGANTPTLKFINTNGTLATLAFSGGVSGPGNLIIQCNGAGAPITFLTGSVNNTGTITNSGTSSSLATISSVIGSAVTGVTQATTGTSQLTLSNAANTYTGPTTITSGILNVGTLAAAGSPSGIGASSGVAGNLVFGASGTLNYTGAAGVVTTNRNFTLTSGGTATFSIATAGAEASFLGATGAATTSNLAVTGQGTLTLTGVNTYTGTTTVSSFLKLVNGAALSNTAITVNNGAIFSPAFNTAAGDAGAGALGATLTVNSGGALNLADGTVGNFTLNQQASFAGGNVLTLSGGSLSFDLGATLGSNDQLVVGPTGTAAASVSGTNTVFINASGGALTPGTYTLITAGSGLGTNANYSMGTTGVFAGGQAYNFTLNATSTALTVTVSAGTLAAPLNAFWKGGVAPSPASWSSQSGTLFTTNWVTTPSGTADTFALPSSGTNVTVTANSATNFSAMTLDAPFTINSLTYSGNSTANVAGSALAAGIGGASSSLTINAATLNGNTAPNGITVAVGSGNNTISANVVLAVSQTWTNNAVAANMLTVSGSISGAGLTLTKLGTGGLTLSGANSYGGNAGGTILTAGTLNVSSDLSLGAAPTSPVTNLTVTASSTLQAGATNVTLGANRGINVTNSSTLTLDSLANTLTINGPITNSSGSAALTKISAGTAILANAGNSYTGATTLTLGTLSFRGGGSTSGTMALPSSTTVTLTSGTFEVLNDSAGTLAYGNAINVPAITGIINVGNNGGGTTGSTIAFGALSTAATATTSTTTVSGANGYGVSFTALNLPGNLGATTTLTANANVTISGAVTNRMSGFGAGNFDTLAIAGSATGSAISGIIADGTGGSITAGGYTPVTKTGTGTWTLSAANTYTGNTTVTAGTLQLTGGGGAGTQVIGGSQVLLNNPAGTLLINGNVTIGNGSATLTITQGTVVAGGATGTNGNISLLDGTINTLTIKGNAFATASTFLTLGGVAAQPSALSFDMGNSSTDQIVVTPSAISGSGKLVLNAGGAVVNLNQLPGTTITTAGSPYTLMTYASGSTFTGAFTLGAISHAPAGLIFSLTQTGTALQLNVTAGPGASNTFWAGTTDSNWNTTSPSTNFATTFAGGTAAPVPYTDTNVFFTTTGATPATFATTNLVQSFTINSLSFTGTGNAASNAAIIAGTVTTPLTINAGAGFTDQNAVSYGAGTGIVVQSGVTVADTISAPVSLGNPQTWSNNGTNTLTASGVVSGPGLLTISNGTNTTVTTLSGANTFTGGLTVSGGIVKLTSATAAGAVTGTVTINSGGTVDLGGAIGNPITLSGGTLAPSAAETFTSSITVSSASTIDNFDPLVGTAAFDLITSGTLHGSGNLSLPSFAQATPDSSGLRLRGPVSDYTGRITLGSSSKFEIQTIPTGTSGSPAGTGTIIMTGGTTTTTNAGTFSICNLRNTTAGNYTFGNNLEMTGSGTALLNILGTANTTMSMGSLLFTGSGQGLAAVSTTVTGTILFTSVTLNGNGTVVPQLVGNATYLAADNFSLGPITDNGGGFGLTMAGAAKLTLTSANSYSGATVLNSGTTVLGAAGALPSATALSVNFSTGATVLDFNNGGTSNDQTVVSLSGTGAAGASITNSDAVNTRTFTVNQSASTTYNGVITGKLNLTKSDVGALTLAGANTYTGATNIQNGTLALGTLTGATVGSLASTSAVTLGNGANSGVLQLGDATNPANQTVASLTTSGSGAANAVVGANAANSVLTISNSAADTYAGVLGGGGTNQNNLALTKSNVGALSLSNTSSYTGDTTVLAGDLRGTGSLTGSTVKPSTPGSVWAGVAGNAQAVDAVGNERLIVNGLDMTGGGKVKIAAGSATNYQQLFILGATAKLNGSGGAVLSTLSLGLTSGSYTFIAVDATTSGGNPIAAAFDQITANNPSDTSNVTVTYLDNSTTGVQIGASSVFPANRVQVTVNGSVSPVKIAAFEARARGAGVDVSWTAVSEFKNAGFNIYRRALDGGTWEKANPALIAGRITNADEKKYAYYDWTPAGTFEYKLESVGISNEREEFFPKAGAVTVDWNSQLAAADDVSVDTLDAAANTFALDASVAQTFEVSARVAAIAQTRESRAALSVRAFNANDPEVSARSVVAAAPSTISPLAPLSAQSVAAAAGIRWFTGGTPANTAGGSSYSAAKLVYAAPGVMLIPQASMPAGYDIHHVSLQREGRYFPALAITPAGLLVYLPGYQDDYTDKDAVFMRRIAGNTAVGPNSPATGLFGSALQPNVTSSATVEADYHDVYFDYSLRPYNFAPWFSAQYLTQGTTQNFTLNAPLPTSGAATITVNLWSLTQSDTVNPDHGLTVLINNQPVGSQSWDGGNQMLQLQFSIPAGVLVNGANTISLSTPSISGLDASTQIAFLHSMVLNYTRLLDGSKAFPIVNSSASAQMYELYNIPAGGAYVVDARFTDHAALVPAQTIAQPDGTLHLRFIGGNGGTGQFLVVPAGQENSPLAVSVRQVKATRLSGTYLATGPSQFGSGVQALLTARAREGVRGSYVDQEQLFDYYNYGRFGPAGIQKAVRSLRPQYLLLLGKTTFDYRNYSGLNIDPLCPTFLVSTSFWAQTTSDSTFGDLGRGYTEVAIGRLPVANATELGTAVSRILSYKGPSSEGSGIRLHAVADRADPDAGDFAAQLGAIQASHHELGWQSNYLGITYQTAPQVHSAMSDAANGGADLIMYAGHGNASRLGATEPRILDNTSIADWKGNVVFIQATCTANWVANNVPGYHSIAMQGLTQPGGGISASIASSTYMNSNVAADFMNQLLRNVQAGTSTRWGTALMKTQQWAAAKGGASSFYTDMSNTEQIFGDPAMRIYAIPAITSGAATSGTTGSATQAGSF